MYPAWGKVHSGAGNRKFDSCPQGAAADLVQTVHCAFVYVIEAECLIDSRAS